MIIEKRKYSLLGQLFGGLKSYSRCLPNVGTMKVCFYKFRGGKGVNQVKVVLLEKVGTKAKFDNQFYIVRWKSYFFDFANFRTLLEAVGNFQRSFS